MILRRILFWSEITLSGALRAGIGGTFGVTSVSRLGAISIHPPTVGNMLLTYGPIAENGDVRITLVYDHRVCDGGTVAKYLENVETILNTLICEELDQLHSATDLRIAV